MEGETKVCRSLRGESGSVLLIVAAAMVVLLAICAIAIDMANLYLARAQAQRAADAAALAGAKAFITTGCTTGGCSPGGVQEAAGRQLAEAAGAQNFIAGNPASIQDGDVTFSYPSAYEPQITVLARASVPTFFARVFGISNAIVSAQATAEAYNPAGGGNSPIAAACLKPFLVPNCDPVHTSPANPACATSGQGYFFDPTTGTIEHPETYPTGIIGMPWTLHSNAGPNHGQDTIDITIGPPFPITGGANNPNPALIGQVFYDYSQSPSVVTVPVYNGSSLPPAGTQVTIVGYMQVFIKDAQHKGNSDDIDVVILNVSSCGGSPGGGSGGTTPPVVAASGSPIPIRLIRPN